MANKTIPDLSTITTPSSNALLWLNDSIASPPDRSMSLLNLAKYFGKTSARYTINSAGGAIGLTAWSTENLILTYAGASTVTLPQASTCIGYKVRILAGYAGAALVTITPYSGDHIDLQSANVSVYLNNSDTSANVQKYRYVDLIAISSGYWAVVGGDYIPYQGVDTEGSSATLGRLHLISQSNTDRRLAEVSLSATGWYGPYSASAIKGIPAKAKGLRLNVYIQSTSTYSARVSFATNTTVTPSFTTSHPMVGFAGGAGELDTIVDIAISSTGTFYVYTSISTGSPSLVLKASGFYTGD